MGWACSTYVGEKICTSIAFCWGILLESGHLENQIRDRRMSLGSILSKWFIRMGGGWNWLRIVSNGGLWY
jgi:hypothetical protein